MVSRIVWVISRFGGWCVVEYSRQAPHGKYAEADGVTHHMVERKSKIGSTDGSMQHCHSDVMAIMTQVGIPELITHVTEEGSVDDMV